MVLRYKATIPESKVFYRIYEVKGDMNLFQFNSFITDDLGFSRDQMVTFEGYDAEGNFCSQYGLFDLGDGAMDSVTFEKTTEKGETEIRFYFDLRNDRYISLVLEGESPFMPMRPYPYLVDEKGQNPDQFKFRYEEAEPEFRPKSIPAPDFKSGRFADDDDDDYDDEDDDDDEKDDKIFDEEEVYPDGDGED